MDKIEICNMALARIGQSAIETLEEASESARQCKRFYDIDRKILLRKYPWNFAVKQVQLALNTETPNDYKYSYAYPSDAVCLLGMYDEHFSKLPRFNKYKVVSNASGKRIYTDVENAYIEYIADITDCNLYDDQFTEALSWKIAGDMAFKLTGNFELAKECLNQLAVTLTLDAEANNDNEDNVLNPKLDTIALSRFVE